MKTVLTCLLFTISLRISTADVGLCRCSGDTHCQSFDGRSVDFPGNCKHILARDNCEKGLPAGSPSWLVAVDTWRRGTDRHVSWVKEVFVIAAGYVIRMKQDGVLELDGVQTNLPVKLGHGIHIYDMPHYVWMETDFGLTVMWDRNYSVRVIVEKEYQEKVCGLCADYDGNPGNDLIVGPNDDCPEFLTDPDAKPGGKTDDLNHLGYSWLLGADDDDCDCELKPGPCSEEDEIAAEQKCDDLQGTISNIKACLEKKTRSEAAEFVSDCVFDECEVSLSINATVCSEVNQQAFECSDDHKLIITWRDQQFCDGCPEGYEDVKCMPPCKQTCEDPKAKYCVVPANHCVQGCVCRDDYVVIDGQCRPVEECGCVDPNSGRIIKEGETVLSEDCTQSCTCLKPGSDAKCKVHKCDKDKHCEAEGTESLCVCNSGYVDENGDCIETAVCSCSGDPHCNQFDGSSLSYQGTCKYTIARDVCQDGLPQAEPNFEVLIDNHRVAPNRRASRVEKVTVLFPKHDLEIVLGQEGVVEINGKITQTPSTPNPDVRIFDLPHYVNVVSEQHGLKVEWDREYSVRVSVSPKHRGNTCGMCGVYDNNEEGDKIVGPSTECLGDYKAKPGEVTDDDVLLGSSWFHSFDESDASCKTDCETPPVPEECQGLPEQLATAACNEIQRRFQKCLNIMRPKLRNRFIDDCTFDICATGDARKYKCLHAQRLEAFCATKYGLNIDYRSPDFCPADCPSGSSYNACASSCQATCDDMDGSKCADVGTCSPGCVCDDGLYFDGKSCVTREKCPVPEPSEPVYPCTSVVDPATQEKADGTLECFTCKNVQSQEDCIAQGAYETCLLPDAICEFTKNVQRTGTVVKMNRKCISRSDCPEGSLGKTVCSPVNQAIKSCTICYYGDVVPNPPGQPVFRCKSQADRAVCKLPKDAGIESGHPSTRYFFNEDKCECQTFPYRGVGGNANNFPSEEACAAVCVTWSMPDECHLPLDEGPCTDFKRLYYYNKETNLCKRFSYGGCEGNANRFSNKIDCRNTCKRCT